MRLHLPLTALAVLFLTARSHAGGTWFPLKNPPPVPIGHFLLLSDGTVMGEDLNTNDGPGWYKLVPDSHGFYVNGTWTKIAPMSYTRLDFATEVLQDGRVFVAGGEYGSGAATSEVYNPLSNTWTTVPVPTSLLNPAAQSPVFNITQRFADSAAVVISNGDVLISPVGANALGETMIFNPGSDSWSAGPSSAYDQDEASWVKLPDDSILTVDFQSTTAERYIPSLNTWKADASAPVQLYDSNGSELGPALLLPNGKAIFFGGTSNTAIYTPSGTTNAGSWVAGPDFPDTQGMPDSPGAMLVNGKVLCAVAHVAIGTKEWSPPVSFYEYDYLSNTFTSVSAPVPGTNPVYTNWGNGGSGYAYSPGGGTNFEDVSWPTLMVDLPDGTVLFGHRRQDFYVYVPDGVPLAAGKPNISSITINGDSSLHLTGTLFNGLCQGAAYGDDEQMDSNFPLVRFTDASGIVRYGRTYNWSNTGVQKTSLIVSVDCAVPPGASTQDDIQVVANGIASGTSSSVVNTNDSGPGSLRQTIAGLPPGSTVTFAPWLSGQTIWLTSGELMLTSNLTIDASSLPGGVAISSGGSNRVFEVDGATVTFNSLTITNGVAGSGFGGGILNFGTVILSQCTLSGNSSSQGGAMENVGNCFMTNCTLTGNVCTGNGGAVDDNNGSLSLTHCTVVGNSAGGAGGGVANYLRTLTLLNTIVAGNSGNGSDIYNFPQSTVVHSGSNIVQAAYYDPTGTNTGNADITSPPMLAPLGNYGGLTLTMTPLVGSPAIDSAVATAVTVDQRGVLRPVGPGPDIGAVEYDAPIVTTASDNIVGSLRYASTYTPNGGTTTFGPNLTNQTFVLSNGPITLNHNFTIDGSAFANGVTISGNSNSQILVVNSGVTAVLNSLTLSSGFSSGGYGGAIESFGNLTLEDCQLVNNRCVGGLAGALAALSGTLTMSNTTVAGNVCDNVSGVFLQDETATLMGCTFSGNSGVDGDALQMYSYTSSSQLTAVNTTFSGNSVIGGASAITIQSVPGRVSLAVLTNCTVVSNIVSAASQPGAIYLQPGGGNNLLYLANTIVSGNLSGGAAGDITGSAEAGSSFNLIGAGGGLVNGVNGNKVGINNPQLEPLGNYGGLTQTMPPLAASPEVDAGGNAYIAGISTDQRGLPRIIGPAVDIGAAEYSGNPVVFASDSGPGSLRYAVSYCPAGTTVTFATNLSGQKILLTSGVMTANNNLVVDASALPNGVTINGNSNSQIFVVNGGVSVVLNSLTFSNGFNSAGGFGGAIESFGNLTLEDCRLVNNHCLGTSGALTAAFGQLTMSNTTVAGNVCDNVSGVYLQDETAALMGCTFSGNSGAGGDALHLHSVNSSSQLTAVNTTFSGNSGNGGVSAITVQSAAGLVSLAVLTNCTVVSNIVSSASQPGAIYVQPSGGTNLLYLANTIVSGNLSGGTASDITGSAEAGSSFNLIGAGGGLVNGVNGNQVGINNPELEPLGNYGGPTQTMAPQPGSPAIDAGSDAVASGIATDQRGLPRVVGASVDIGAVEYESAPLVLNDADGGPGSLRYVMTYTTNGTTIGFAPGLAGSTVLLTGGEILLSHGVTIDASALAGGITINGNAASRVFEVDAGYTAVLNSLTITNGADPNGSGGGILNNGTLTLNQCVLSGNYTPNPGGMDGLGGAAIYNGGSGNLTLNQCTISNNSCPQYPSRGGGIFNVGTLAVNQSTISSNSASFSGGGIFNNSGLSASVLESTMVGNTTEYGGGIDNFAGTVVVVQSTVVGNAGPAGGGGIFNYVSPAIINLTNSIVAANSSSQGADIDNANNVTLGGANIIQSEYGGIVSGPNPINANPLLAPLGNYGGPTQTMPPLPGSPAVDAGSDAAAIGISTDQRGYNRFSGASVDIGAVEVQIASGPYQIGGVEQLGNGSIQLGLTNLVGGSFSVYATTNLTLPFNSWSNLGTALETPIGSGHFQFTDPYASNYTRRFYRMSSP